jgi:integrase
MNPIDGLKLPTEDIRDIGLSADEIRIITHATHPRFSRFFRMVLWTGRRPNEIARLTRDNVVEREGKDGKPHLCLKIDGKNKKKKGQGEFLGLAPDAEALLKEALDEFPEGLLFPSEEGSMYCEKNWNRPLRMIGKRQRQRPWTYGQEFGAICRTQATIRPEVTMYYARYEFINTSLMAGNPPAVIARLVGNSVRTILRYYESLSQRTVGELQEAADLAVAKLTGRR